MTEKLTFEDDSVRIEGRLYSCRDLGLEWPPPEMLHVYVQSPGIAVVSPLEHPAAVEYRRVSCSQITDEDRASMTHVFRGAEYEPAVPAKGGDNPDKPSE